MSTNFEELDYCETPLGPLSLRRRRILPLDGMEVFEVKLGEEFLMSSLFHVVEVALADLGLAAVEGPELEVAVGGLGLGYTARAALASPRVASLIVIDALAEVIGWHVAGRVPLGRELASDPRCRFVHADFFEQVRSAGLDPADPVRRFHAILLDIDHTPTRVLHASNVSLYTTEGLRQLAGHLHPKGIFAMWSDDPPDEDFLRTLGEVFSDVRAEVVTFFNPLLDCDSASTVYIARRAD